MEKTLTGFGSLGFFETKVPDLGLSAAIKGSSAKLSIKNKGGLPLPVHLTFLLADGSVAEKHMGADVWKDKSTLDLKVKFDQPISQVALGAADIPDADRSDNKHVEDVR